MSFLELFNAKVTDGKKQLSKTQQQNILNLKNLSVSSKVTLNWWWLKSQYERKFNPFLTSPITTVMRSTHKFHSTTYPVQWQNGNWVHEPCLLLWIKCWNIYLSPFIAGANVWKLNSVFPRLNQTTKSLPKWTN